MAIIPITEGAAAIGGSESIPKGSYSEGKAGNRKDALLAWPR